MAKAATPFSPEKNGFEFVNYFQFHFPVKYPLPFGGEIDLNNVVYGLCGGMCFAALDYFYAGQPRPDDAQPDHLDPKLFTYLCERQLESLSIPILIKIIEWMMLDEAEIGRRIARTEIPKLRTMLDKGNPVNLCLIRVSGLNDPTHNHQAVATGYDYDENSKDMTIPLYDPNHPCQDPYIKLSLANPSGGLSLSQSTGEVLRGFFVLPYTPQKLVPAPSLAAAATLIQPGLAEAAPDLAAVPTFRLQWPVDSRRINQKFHEHPESYRPFGLPGHEGLDLFAVSGANVYAAADGEVYRAGFPAGPYGRQIRIRHTTNGQVYHTIYAHLSQIQVQIGQQVKAGDLIGFADNTGNSFGSHLHLTLKQEGALTPGYPPGIIDPLPYLDSSNSPFIETILPSATPLPALSGISVYTTTQLNLRSGPNTDAEVIALLSAGELLSLLGSAADVQPKIGQDGQWLQVQTASGKAGFAAALYLQNAEQQPFPPSDVVVYPFDALNLRSGPGTAFPVVASLSFSDPLTILGDGSLARTRIGKKDQWLQVETEAGQNGFVAAWLVHLTGQAAPTAGLVVYPTAVINLRARPGDEASILAVLELGDALETLGDRSQALGKIGQIDQWLNVRSPQKFSGYVAAWLVSDIPTDAPPSQAAAPAMTVYPTADVNLRAQPGINSPRVGGISKSQPMAVLETDPSSIQSRLGQEGQWIYGQGPDGKRGWVAAWFLSAAPMQG